MMFQALALLQIDHMHNLEPVSEILCLERMHKLLRHGSSTSFKKYSKMQNSVKMRDRNKYHLLMLSHFSKR